MILHDLITIYKNDTVNEGARDSLISLLIWENKPNLLYQLVFIRFSDGDSAEAMNVLDYIENSFDLNNISQSIHQQYRDYMVTYSEIISSNDTAFAPDSLSRTELYDLAGHNTFTGSYARNVLQFYDTLVYIEPYILPSGQVKTGGVPVISGKQDKFINDTYRIYPNPAMSYFVAEYFVLKSSGIILELVVSDISGRVLQKTILPSNPGHKIISTKDLKPGLYLCKFVLDGKERQTIKLSVIK